MRGQAPPPGWRKALADLDKTPEQKLTEAREHASQLAVDIVRAFSREASAERCLGHLRFLAAAAAERVGAEAVDALVTEFGAAHLADLEPERAGEFAERLRAL